MTVILFSCRRHQRVTQYELRNHIRYLASDSLKGRMTGSSGDSLAAEYIRNDLASNGLVPLIDDGWQRFALTTSVTVGNNILGIDKYNYMAGLDFQPLSFSSNDSLEAEVVFAGYGFNIANDTLTWNDYSAINVKGKWVMILRGNPFPGNIAFDAVNTDKAKALIAKDKGAAGTLFVSGSAFDADDRIQRPGIDHYPAGIPAFRIRRDLANIILSQTGNNIDSLESRITSQRKPVAFNTRSTVKANAELLRETAPTRNVAMILPGKDPDLADEFLIIGAHFDHLGMGGLPGRQPDTVSVHPGADDNASGIAMMLELAEKFALNDDGYKRSLVFVAFSGEELGLLGSRYFTDSMKIDPGKINAMINLDMVGRLNRDRTLQISGVGTAAGLRGLVLSLSDTSMINLLLSDMVPGPSDHSSFYAKDIPVLLYFTGLHQDYHSSEDTFDKINYDGMVRISDLIYAVASNLASADSTLTFIHDGLKTETPGVR